MKKFQFLSILLLLLFISACKKNNGDFNQDLEQHFNLLSQYFSAATTGTVSASDPLVFVLLEPLSETVNENLLQSIIKLDPNVPGKVTLNNNTILTFTPDEPLKPNQIYQVNIAMKDLDSKQYSQNISYSIRTFNQQIKVEREGFVLNDDDSTSILVGVKTADKVDINRLISCFKSDAASIIAYERSSNDYQLEFTYPKILKSDPYIKYDGKNIHVDIVGEIPVFEFDTKVFGVVYTFHDKTSKELNIYFSQKLDKNFNLDGLLTLQGKTPKYTIKNNILTVFLANERYAVPLTIKLDKNIKSIEGKSLASDYTFEIESKIDSPSVEFIGDGNYFPSEGNFKIPIKSRALKAIRLMVIEIKQENVQHYLAWQSIAYADYYNLRMYGKPIFDKVVDLTEGVIDSDGWSVYGLDISNQIKKNPGSIYHISMDFTPENIVLSCKDNLKKYKTESNIPGPEYFYDKEAYYRDYYYYEDYNWENNNNPCDIAYYAYKQPVQKLFICSDFSIIAKKAGNSYHFAVSKLLDLNPVSDAQITLYDLQAEKMGTLNTSSDGFAQMSVKQGNAAVAKITKGNQTTYMVLDDAMSNSLTEFAISGERTETDSEFFIYTERDVWRPGDSIFLNVMVNSNYSALPEGLPIVLSFYNTENLLIDEQIQNVNLKDKLIYNFVLKTNATSKTGQYRCMIKVGTKSLRKNIRIETIKPNTIETIYVFDKSVNQVVYSNTLSGTITSQYLTGFAAKNTKVVALAKARPDYEIFNAFSEYHFDVKSNLTYENIDLLSTTVDENGKAAFEANHDFKVFNTPITLNIETESVLADGGANKEGKKIKLSPFESYVGAQRNPGNGWNGNHTFAENIDINLVNLDEKGKLKKNGNTIEYKLYKHLEQWWIDKYRLQSWGNFNNDQYWSEVNQGSIKITGKSKINLPKGTLQKGAYKMVMVDQNSSHKTEVYFTVYDGFESIPTKEAYIIELQTDKDTYNAGESVKLVLPNIQGAKALISIERGNKVIQQMWHNINNKNNELVIKTDENWVPNVYIHVTLMQPYSQNINDLPLRLYGISHVKMTGLQKQLLPVTDLPNQLESNKSYSFKVSESEGRPMEYTLALVDEGLLGITGFRTPDPHRHFNGKYPLLVKTWDIYNFLIQYFKGQFAGVIAIGGDDAYQADAIEEINRFKPVVIHLGSFKVGAKSNKSHMIKIPNYIGKVRLMVVACNENNFGKLDKSILIKNPLMVQSQFPRTLNVSDKLQLPVQIFRADNNIKSATLTSVATANMVKGFIPSKTINFGTQDQLKEMYTIEVLNKTGKLDVNLGISGGGKSMNEKTEILINYPNAFSSDETKQIINPGDNFVLKVTPKGYKEVFESQIAISGLKVPNFTAYAQELINYPYGCLEQVTSAGFGQLYLDKVIDLDPKDNRVRLENIQATIHKLIRLQKADGTFSYWENNYYHAWSDIYAGNYLVELQKLSFLPQNSEMVKSWIKVHTDKANNWYVTGLNNKYLYETEALAQAFRLYVLSKASKPAKSAMNRFVSSSTAQNPLTWWLMAGCFKKSGYDSKAKELITKAENLQKNRTDNYHEYGSFGSSGRDLALIVAILSTFEDQKPKMEDYYNAMVDKLNESGWQNTQTKGFAFIAAYQYFGEALKINQDVEYTVLGLDGNKQFKHNALSSKKLKLTSADYGKSITIQNTGKGKIFVNQTSRYIDDNLIVEGANNNLGLQVEYYNATQKKNGIENIKLGDDIQINVFVSNPSALSHENMALNVKMASGWELINPRIYETDQKLVSDKFIYQDYKDDRVYTFFNLEAGQSLYYKFRAKAAFTGNFYLPSISCEHMYKGNINAKTKSQRTNIIQ